jgi:hypothetical protein
MSCSCSLCIRLTLTKAGEARVKLPRNLNVAERAVEYSDFQLASGRCGKNTLLALAQWQISLLKFLCCRMLRHLIDCQSVSCVPLASQQNDEGRSKCTFRTRRSFKLSRTLGCYLS